MKRRGLGCSGISVSEIGLGTMTFGSMVDEGKVRAVGCSNQNTYGLMKNLWAADRLGTARYQTIQNNFSLLSRRFEDELADACRREKISLLPYSPIAGGVLSGKYQDGAWPADGRFSYYRNHNPRTQRMTKRFVNERTLAATERLSALAACDDIWKEIRYPME